MSSQKASTNAPPNVGKDDSLIDPKLLEQNNPGSFEDLHKKTKGEQLESCRIEFACFDLFRL